MIISLSYKARVGKDTVADYLVKKYSFCKTSFADPLKRGCKEIFSLTDEQVYGSLKETVDEYWQMTPRYILQKVGTDCLRNHFDKDVWVKATGAKVLSDPNKNFVIPDARFPNELEAVRNWGGKLIKVTREETAAITGIVKHESEIALENYSDWDFILVNDGSFDDLYEKVDGIMRNVL